VVPNSGISACSIGEVKFLIVLGFAFTRQWGCERMAEEISNGHFLFAIGSLGRRIVSSEHGR